MSDAHSDRTYRPDLNDETNVGRTHASFEGATAATIRERRFSEHGNEPVPLWVFLVAGFALLVGGAVLGNGGTLFSYSQESMWASDFEAAPAGDGEILTEGPAMEFFVNAGAKTYTKCAGCHGGDGNGDGANYPPLAGSEWVTSDDTEALAMIILNGVAGPIEVKGKTWNNVMPAQGPLGAKELASVMTYLRNDLNDVGDIVTVEMAQAALEVYQSRGPGKAMSASELKSAHMQPLPGDALDPEIVVDFATYQPVANAGGN
jgi:mono/diheme cytochrome c family protein